MDDLITYCITYCIIYTMQLDMHTMFMYFVQCVLQRRTEEDREAQGARFSGSHAAGAVRDERRDTTGAASSFDGQQSLLLLHRHVGFVRPDEHRADARPHRDQSWRGSCRRVAARQSE